MAEWKEVIIPWQCTIILTRGSFQNGALVGHKLSIVVPTAYFGRMSLPWDFPAGLGSSGRITWTVPPLNIQNKKTDIQIRFHSPSAYLLTRHYFFLSTCVIQPVGPFLTKPDHPPQVGFHSGWNCPLAKGETLRGEQKIKRTRIMSWWRQASIGGCARNIKFWF